MRQRPRALKVRNRNPLNTRAMSLLQSSVQFGAASRGGALRYRSALPPQRGCRAGDPGLPLATLFRAVGAKSKARCTNARCTSKLNSRSTKLKVQSTKLKDQFCDNKKAAFRAAFTLQLLLPVSPFFFNDTATPEIYTLPLHDALPC